MNVLTIVLTIKKMPSLFGDPTLVHPTVVEWLRQLHDTLKESRAAGISTELGDENATLLTKLFCTDMDDEDTSQYDALATLIIAFTCSQERQYTQEEIEILLKADPPLVSYARAMQGSRTAAKFLTAEEIRNLAKP